jgi:tetratricopeptide (TPR) repeat protein
MTAILTAITLGLTGGMLQPQDLHLPDPRLLGPPAGTRQVDNPHWSDIFNPDATACPGGGGCRPETLSGRPRGGVSAPTLAHKQSKAAKKALDRGVRAWNKRQADQAVRYFWEALRLDPDYWEARADLGIVYVKTDRPVEALVQYELALSLEPNVAALHSNEAAALVMLNRCPEAEKAARRALQLDPELVSANYMLGVSMLMQGRVTSETVTHLEVAAKIYPNARKFLEFQAELATQSKVKTSV